MGIPSSSTANEIQIIILRFFPFYVNEVMGQDQASGVRG
jgi:hypothetical protein